MEHARLRYRGDPSVFSVSAYGDSCHPAIPGSAAAADRTGGGGGGGIASSGTGTDCSALEARNGDGGGGGGGGGGARSSRNPLHHQTGRRAWFTPWVWGMWRDRYIGFADAPYIGWDSQLNFEALPENGFRPDKTRPGLRGSRVEVFPVLSRCNNIGMEGAVWSGAVLFAFSLLILRCFCFKHTTGNSTQASMGGSNIRAPSA